MSKTVKTTEQKKSDKAAYDKARRANKKAGRNSTGHKILTTSDKLADRAAIIAERAELKKVDPKATAGTHGRAENKAVVTKTPKPAKELTTHQPTVASVARQMVIAGQTDEDIFIELERQFHVGAEKKYYPCWYRSQLVRKGVITKAFADEHRHTK